MCGKIKTEAVCYMNRDLPKLRGIIMKNWMSAKGLVIGALLLLGSSVAAGDGDCTDKNPGKLPKFL